MTQTLDIDAALAPHDAVFLDAYGVLVDHAGALPGAAALLGRLRASGKPHFILTNDASRLPETIERRFASMGLPVALPQIISSGMAIAAYFATAGLAGSDAVVLGNADSKAYVSAAGGHVLPLDAPDAPARARALVICDDSGQDPWRGLELATHLALTRLRQGLPLALVLANPDLIFPKGAGAVGFTAGSLARLVEAALDICLPQVPEPRRRFVGLGKPYAPIFTLARQISGAQNPVMVGDQLGTDVLGATRAHMASVLLGTGLTHWDGAAPLVPPPTYFVPKLQ